MRKHALDNNAADPVLEASPVNLTPLIDVVFVVLIMFITIAPLLNIDHVNLAAGLRHANDSNPNLSKYSAIVIHVYENNAIKFNNAPTTIEQLPQLLHEAKKNHPTDRPQIFHDRKAYFGTYQAIKDMIEEAGFEQMDILLSSK